MGYCDDAVWWLVACKTSVIRTAIALLFFSILPITASPAAAQQVLTQPTRTVTIARGGSALVQTTDPVQRMSIADPAIADATAVSLREILITAKTVGTTTLLLWDRQERVSMFSVIVTPDIGALQRQISQLFPNVNVTLSASGAAIIVSGNVRDPHIARRILEVVRSSGATVIDNLAAPTARQVLLHVRFADEDVCVGPARSADSYLNVPAVISAAEAVGPAVVRLDVKRRVRARDSARSRARHPLRAQGRRPRPRGEVRDDGGAARRRHRRRASRRRRRGAQEGPAALVRRRPRLLRLINRNNHRSSYSSSASGKERWRRGGTRKFCRWVVRRTELKPSPRACGWKPRFVPSGRTPSIASRPR